jgi:hypothetical protein
MRDWTARVDLRPAQNAFVDVSAGLDTATDTASWKLTTINATTGQPITDVINGFLPPDTSPPDGDGSISFDVTPKANLSTGTAISNMATIVFDTNSPINTPAWVNTIDRSAPTSRIVRVKRGTAVIKAIVRRRSRARRQPLLSVYWTGADRYSGIGAYDVYAAPSGHRFQKVLSLAPTNHGVFVCKRGVEYRFYTVAHSAVGNVQIGHSRPSKPVACG